MSVPYAIKSNNLANKRDGSLPLISSPSYNPYDYGPGYPGTLSYRSTLERPYFWQSNITPPLSNSFQYGVPPLTNVPTGSQPSGVMNTTGMMLPRAAIQGPSTSGASSLGSSSSGPFQCPLCPQTFDRQARLQGHMHLHNSDGPFMCDGSCGIESW